MMPLAWELTPHDMNLIVGGSNALSDGFNARSMVIFLEKKVENFIRIIELNKTFRFDQVVLCFSDI